MLDLSNFTSVVLNVLQHLEYKNVFFSENQNYDFIICPLIYINLKRAVTRVIGSKVRTNRKCMFVLQVMAKLLVHVNLIGGSERYLNNMTDQERQSDENKEKQPQRLTFANFRSVARLRLC